MKRFVILSTLLTCMVVVGVNAQVSSDIYRNTPKGGVVSSGALPDLIVSSDDGEMLKLRDICDGNYTLLITGCLTCPEFRRDHPTLEAINADYAPLGINTYFIYKSLRHPELDGYVEAQKLSERLMMVDRIKGILGGVIPWLVDDMSNNVSAQLRSGSRSAYLISSKGEIIQAWAAPEEQSMRRALTQAVGSPAQVTSVGELSLPPFTRAQKRSNEDSDTTIERNDGLVIVKSTPQNPEDTYYVKLRVEADANLLESGTGRLALGFFPDPLYDAHWNNLATPMKYSIELPEGVSATPQSASAKAGKGDSDTAPRQFWVDIKGASPSDKIVITYYYYGCTPDVCETFTHTYIIELKPEAQGASTFGFNKGQRGNNSSGKGERGDGSGRQRSSSASGTRSGGGGYSGENSSSSGSRGGTTRYNM